MIPWFLKVMQIEEPRLTDDELLTWEMSLARVLPLPLQAQVRLIRYVRWAQDEIDRLENANFNRCDD